MHAGGRIASQGTPARRRRRASGEGRRYKPCQRSLKPSGDDPRCWIAVSASVPAVTARSELPNGADDGGRKREPKAQADHPDGRKA